MSKTFGYRPLKIKELKLFQRFLSRQKPPLYPVTCKGKYEYARFEPEGMKEGDFYAPVIFYFRGKDDIGNPDQVLTLAPHNKLYVDRFEEWKRKES